MIYGIGKALEMIGLAIVGIGLLIGIQLANERAELTYLALGGATFTIGWMLERSKRGK